MGSGEETAQAMFMGRLGIARMEGSMRLFADRTEGVQASPLLSAGPREVREECAFMADLRVRPDAMCSSPTLCTVPALPVSQCRRGANAVVFRPVVSR